MNRYLFIIIAVLAVLVGFYPLIYFIIEGRFGLLASKSEELINNYAWKFGFYAHIFPGGIAMLVGWMQFVDRWRINYPRFHRTAGKVYVIAAIISSLAAIAISVFSTGGVIPAAGFMLLGITWFFTTLKAFTSIRHGRIETHKRLMIYSYSACLSAVTLRIYLPILIMIFSDFIVAYSIVAWLCWVPNIIIAFFLIKKIRRKENLSVLRPIELPNDEPSVATEAQ